MSETNTIKSYAGGKSKALRGLKSYLGDKVGNLTDEQLTKLLFQYEAEGKYLWSFDTFGMDADVAKLQTPVAETQIDPADLPDAGNDAATGDTSNPASDETPQDDTNPVTSQGVFGALSTSLVNTQNQLPAGDDTVSATRQQSRSTYTIDKDRKEQNGVKERSKGGLCRAVWDFCDQFRAANDRAPECKEVKAHAPTQAWNLNNAVIEFYCWRKHHGIVGRTAKKVEPAAEPSQNTVPANPAAADATVEPGATAPAATEQQLATVDA